MLEQIHGGDTSQILDTDGGTVMSSFASEHIPSFIKPRMQTIQELIQQSKSTRFTLIILRIIKNIRNTLNND
jgi:hypothetical protein